MIGASFNKKTRPFFVEQETLVIRRVTVNSQFKKRKTYEDGKRSVYLRCTLDEERFELLTGIFIPDSCNNRKQKPKGKTGKQRSSGDGWIK